MSFQVIEGGKSRAPAHGAGRVIERTGDGGYRVRRTLLGAVFFATMTLFVITGGQR